ncbi:sodium:calcium antiporter [Haloplanus aerogenes]|uniref:Cation:H+ antiporter n=1 Tax=Haloplanus aerogenes TaxID=660522 RepID=A0A3M0CU93_9EURY|nr:sodium:proton exchanger [Haloplanus aerogenes]AZH26736.1 sodium:proton exchanger [Haloplanus aerogenes]RMB12981.1 cation:H+ antiporter [Haloplanus aerogenes]
MPSHGRIVAGVLLLSLLLASPAASAVAADLGVTGPIDTVVAQEAGEEEEEEGGIEGAISSFVEAQGTIGAVIVLLGGILLLTVCTEKLISYLARASINMRISLFALAIVFTGFEFDDTILALVLSGGGLEQAALGTALGTGLAITGVTLALAAIVRPFPVDLPTDYIVIFALAPVVLVPFVLIGTLTLIHGLILTAFFVFAFAYFIVRERQRDIPVFRDTELGKELRPDGGMARPDALEEIPEERILGNLANSGLVWLGLSVVALAGIVFAAMLLEGGSEVVIEGFGISETVFGATFLTLILTFEDIMLTLEPVRRGFPEIGVGNVIGSVLFSVTGNIGVIMFLSEVTISPTVLTFHLPMMILMTALAAYFFYTKEMKQWHGLVLGGLYVAYWVIALVMFSGVPVGE